MKKIIFGIIICVVIVLTGCQSKDSSDEQIDESVDISGVSISSVQLTDEELKTLDYFVDADEAYSLTQYDASQIDASKLEIICKTYENGTLTEEVEVITGSISSMPKLATGKIGILAATNDYGSDSEDYAVKITSDDKTIQISNNLNLKGLVDDGINYSRCVLFEQTDIEKDVEIPIFATVYGKGDIILSATDAASEEVIADSDIVNIVYAVFS